MAGYGETESRICTHERTHGYVPIVDTRGRQEGYVSIGSRRIRRYGCGRFIALTRPRQSTTKVGTVEDEQPPVMSDDSPIDIAGKQAAYITNEWTDDPAIMQTQALCYVGY